MFKHLFITWIFSNLFYVLFIALPIRSPHPFSFEYLQYLPGILVFSFVYSLPSLVTGWICLYIISKVPHPIQVRFFIWLLTAPSLAFLNCILVLQWLDARIGLSLEMTIPAILATGLAVLIRLSSFNKKFGACAAPGQSF